MHKVSETLPFHSSFIHMLHLWKKPPPAGYCSNRFYWCCIIIEWVDSYLLNAHFPTGMEMSALLMCWILIIGLFLRSFSCTWCMFSVGTHMPLHACIHMEVRGQILGGDYFTTWAARSSSRHQAWWQVLLPMGLSHWPMFAVQTHGLGFKCCVMSCCLEVRAWYIPVYIENMAGGGYLKMKDDKCDSM